MLLVWLLVLNLGVAAWWALHRAPAPVAPEPLDPSVPTLELVPPAAAERRPEQPPEPPRPRSPAVAPTPAPQTPPVVADTEPAQRAPVCASFGPYADDAAAADARRRLAGPGVQVTLRRVGGGNARGYNVSMAPLASREAATAMAERLRGAGFNDLIVISEGDNANGIALGRFGSEANARRHQSALQEKGFAARIVPVGGEEGSRVWLDVRAPAGFDPAAQRQRVGAAQAQPRGC